MSNNRSTLNGFLSPDSPLSPKKAFADLSPITKPIIKYPSESIYQQETARLPFALQKLRKRVRVFAESELKPLALKIDVAEHAELGQTWPETEVLLKKAAAAGLLTDLLPRPLGSVMWRQYRHPLVWQQCIKTEEYARICGGLMLLLSSHSLGVCPLLLSGDIKAIRKFVLPAYKEMKNGVPHLFAFAITEPGAGSDAEDGHGATVYKPGVVAKRCKQRNGWVLNGRKCFISGGDLAKTFTVFAALEKEGMESWTCFVVQRGMPGFRPVRNELKMGMRASAATELEFDDCFVPDDHVVLGLRKGWALNRATLNLSRMPVSAMAVGFAQAALDAAMNFATTMRLGNKPLIHYQEIQLMIAQMVAETSAIRASVWQSAKTYRPRQGVASLNKFYCSDTALKVCELAMELMSNHGILHGNRAEKAFRDARLAQIFEGTNQVNRLALIEDMYEEITDKIIIGARL